MRKEDNFDSLILVELYSIGGFDLFAMILTVNVQ